MVDGNFSLLLTGKKNGDAYSLQQVVKSGYELNESGVIGRPYAFSDKIPLTIVMVSTAQLQAEKIRIENNAYRVAENNYKLRLASLEKQREEKSITAEEYRKEIQDLQDRFEKYQSLISSLAEHYAHTDYDVLNETEREINLCIENGDLERADSLIHTLFNPVDVLKRNSESLARIDRNIRQASEIIRQANEDMAAVLKQQAKDAEYLYQLYTISLARFDNENAARYIETRAQLDTTNVEWQLDAANFLRKYMADYPKAMSVYKKALHHARKQSGEESQDVALCYNNIGLVYDEQGDYSSALEYHQKVLSMQQDFFGEQHPNVASSYNNIGQFYYNNGNYRKAMEYYEKSLKIKLTVLGEQHPDVAVSYINIAAIYDLQKNYKKALYYVQKSLSIRLSVFGEQHPDVALSYNNIGAVYSSQGNYSSALEYFQRALSIYQAVFGEQHPDVARSYNNIGYVYNSQRKYEKSLKYFQKALSIWKAVFGEQHPDVALSYNNIGSAYSDQGNYNSALECYKKALSIQQAIWGERHHDVARSYSNIGSIYYIQENYKLALKFIRKCLEIEERTYGKGHPALALTYSNLGDTYSNLENYSMALKSYSMALELNKSINADEEIALNYNKIGITYYYQKKYKKALEYFKLSLSLYAALHGHNHDSTIQVSINLYNIYCLLLEESPDLKEEFANFISDYAYSLKIDEHETYLLEFNNWSMDSTESIFDHKQDKPVDIVVMAYNQIMDFHLDNIDGCEIGLKFVGKEEKERILKEYNSWKNKQHSK